MGKGGQHCKPVFDLFAPCYALVFVTVLAIGCAPQKVVVNSVPHFQPERIRSVVVMPFDTLSTPQATTRDLRGPRPSAGIGPSGFGDSLVLPEQPVPERLSPPTLTVPMTAAGKMTDMVYANLRSRRGIEVFSPTRAAEAIQTLDHEDQKMNAHQVAIAIAKALSADAVVHGRVRLYRERVGSRMGAEPAAVGFEIRLVSAKDGSTLWIGEYYEAQKPMIEDIQGFVEHGFGFVSAEELTEYGVAQVLKQFPVGS